MLLRLLRYNLCIKYVPGSKWNIADTLSRAHPAHAPNSDNSPDAMRIHGVTATLPATPAKLVAFRQATALDADFMKMLYYIKHGWPKYQDCVSENVRKYWSFKDDIHEENGLLFVNNKLLVPPSIRNELLTKLHESHLGVAKCKARAREVLYWPNMCQDIEQYVSKCAVCDTYRPNNQREPLIPHPVPDRPWSRLGADICTYGGHDYLVVVDYFSKISRSLLNGKSARSVIRAFKPIFARHGIPDIVVCDNMPFASYHITQFAREWGFEIVTSSPTYTQSNGQSERFVGIIKSMFRKAHADGRDPNIALLEYRNTPITGLRYLPAQLLMSRRLNDKLPTHSSLLEPTIADTAMTDLHSRQAKYKSFYDRRSKMRQDNQVGDNVRVLVDKTSDKGVITGSHSAPRWFFVTMENGSILRRHLRFMNKYRSSVMPPQPQAQQPSVVQPTAPVINPPRVEVPSHDPPGTDPPDIDPPLDGIQPRRSNRAAPKWHDDYVPK
jgi:transposase InsO family protein